MPNQEIVTPVVFPQNKPIFKKQNPDGSYSYYSEPFNHPLHLYKDDLKDHLDIIIEHFFQLTNMLDDDQGGTFGILYKTMIHHFSCELGTLCHFIKQEIGKIEVHKVNNGWYEQMIVGVSVKLIDKTE